jgi:hypothetical protein
VASAEMGFTMTTEPGKPAEHPGCDQHPPAGAAPDGAGRVNAIAVIHAVAFALQGLLLSQFLDLSAGPAAGVSLVFGVIGIGVSILWRYWAAMPSWLDMCFGMCTLGNLGMLVGIWTDHRFGTVVAPEKVFWTYGIMLVAGNVAMFRMMRHHHRSAWSDVPFLGMAIGGNLGMLVGMKAGAVAVTHFVGDSPTPVDILGKIAAMTLGMVLGMLVGHRGLRLLLRKVMGASASSGMAMTHEHHHEDAMMKTEGKTP